MRKVSSSEVLGPRIKRLRDERGLTQQELAEKARLQREDISRIENGHLTNLKLRSLEALAKALGVRPGTLLDV